MPGGTSVTFARPSPVRLADVIPPFDDALCRRIVELLARSKTTAQDDAEAGGPR